MLKFAANLSMMFNEVPFLDRFERAAQSGFKAVEFLYPYAKPASEISRRLDAHGVQQVLFNGPPGDWERGERGFGAIPGQQPQFQKSIHLALEYAVALKCSRLHVMAGNPPPASDLEKCEATFMENIAWAATEARKSGVMVLIEPLNPVDMPGYFLSSVSQALKIISEVGSGNVCLQYDSYHIQMSQGRLVETFKSALPVIGHIQVSGVPGRCEPDAHQEINYDYLFESIDRSSYDGWIGCEYRPRNGTENGIRWLDRWRQG